MTVVAKSKSVANLEDHVKEAYIKYGTYVVEERAVADFRDGLKPVQRRILYAMHDMGLTHTSRYMKCSGTVGEVLKFYHPHGDQSVYSTLVGMVWDRYPTVQGKGNFGSETDAPAAYRYTEARLMQASSALFDCMEVAQFIDNFDGTKKEPLVLPSRLPFILLNGNSGIAVGITSEIPPHNLEELKNACLAVLKAGKSATLDTVLNHIQGPDYGSAVLLSSQDEIRNVYDTGEGTLLYRCNYKIEDTPENKNLIVTGYGPRFNVEKFIKSCQKIVNDGNLLYVDDESSADNGKRIVVGFTSGAFLSEHVLPMLETSIAYRFYVTERLSESNIRVRMMPLLQIIKEWIDYNRNVESDVIKNAIKNLETKLNRENARLLGILQIKILAKIISDTVDKSPLDERVAAGLKISKDTANIILDFAIRSLAAATEVDQRKRIADIETDISAQKKVLANIDKLLESKFSKMGDYIVGPDARGTSIRARTPKLDVSDTAEMLVAIEEGGDIQRMEEVPLRKGAFKWNYFIKTGSYCWVVDGTGKLLKRTVSALAKGQTVDSKCRKVPGVFSSFARKVVLLEKDGMAAVIDPTTLARDEYQGMKTEQGVIAVADMVRGDQLIVWNKEVTCSYDYDELETTRTNVNGWRILPRRTATGLLVLKTGGILVGDGKKIKPENVPFCKKVFCITDKNFVIYEDGTRTVLDKEQTVKEVGTNKSVSMIFNNI